jgi:dipeptidyl aminopeptidase/acylaminoacyl peptidase
LKFSAFVAALVAGVALSETAPAAPPPVEVYGALPSVEMMRLSPKGDRIAWISVAGADRKLHVTTADGQSLHDVDFSDIKLRGLHWADDDHVVVEATVTMRMNHFSDDAGEFLQVVALNVPRRSLMVVFNNQAEVVPLVFGAYGYSSDGGHAYGYFGGIRQNDLHYKNSAAVDLFKVDLDDGSKVQVATGTFRDQQWLVDPKTGGVMAAALSDIHSGEWRVEDGGRVLAHGRADFGPARLLGLGKDGANLLIAEPTAGDDEVHEVRPDGSTDVVIPGAGRNFDLRFDRSLRWVGEESEGDTPQVKFYDGETEKKLEAAQAAVGGGQATLVSHDDAFAHLIMKTEGDHDSGTYWLVDTASKAAKPVGRNYPDIPPDQVGAFSMVSWKAADGLALHGVLTLPPGRPAKNLPLVVLPHGGPQARDYLGFDWWAEAFAARGYAVFQPNYRGSSGYGDAFVAAGYGQWGRKMQTDISDGVADLARQGVIDPKRACIVGGSYGGYASLAGVTVQHGLYRCAVSWGGVADLPLMQHTEYRASGSAKSDVTRYWKRFMNGDGPEVNDIAAVSPAKLAAGADAPILLMYGRDDTVVLPQQSMEMADALKKAGKPFEVQVMPGEDHWLSRGATRTAMLKAAVEFVEKHNPPD